MDTNIDHPMAAAVAPTTDADVDDLLEQLAAEKRRAEQACQAAERQVAAEAQARRAVEQTRQMTEQDLRLADLKIQKLTLELAYYKRLHYAAKSEHYQGEQLELFEQDMAADLGAIEAGQETLPPALVPPKRSRAGRRPLPPELPRLEMGSAFFMRSVGRFPIATAVRIKILK